MKKSPPDPNLLPSLRRPAFYHSLRVRLTILTSSLIAISVISSGLATAIIGSSLYLIAIKTGLIVLCTTIAYFVARKLTWPIMELTDASSSVARGHRVRRIRVEDKGELGVLAESFNFMTDELTKAHATLENQVRERTKELLKANDELRKEAARREESTKALKTAEQQTRSIIDTAYDAFVGMDAHGNIISWNLQAEATFGWTKDEVIGMELAETIVPPEWRDDHRDGLENFLKTGDGPVLNNRIEVSACHRDGRQFPVELTITPLKVGDSYLFSAFVHDITARKEAEELSSRLASIVEHANDAILSISPSGEIVTWNPGAERLYGYTAEETVGMPVSMLVPVDQYDSVMTIVRRIFHGERIFTHETRHARKDGSLVDVSLTFSAVRDRADKITGIALTGRDVTERRRAEEALRNAKEVAEAADRSKSEFLANVSHEIRTPMNGIIGMTELALGTDLSPEQQEYLDMVRVSADGLLKVINDILDFSKIEAGRMELEIVDLNLPKLIETTAKNFAVRAHEKGIEIICNVEPGLPTLLTGDPTRVQQVLLNLVGNAVKFTESGEVELRVGLLKETDDWPANELGLHFQVRDTGIGIPTEKQEAIFDAFTQAEGSTTRRFGGTGLGLSICSRIVKLMNGRLWVESEPGRGSIFHFTARFGVPKGPVLQWAPATERRLIGLKVLIADDNSTNCRILTETVTGWQMQPSAVSNGTAALEALLSAEEEGCPFELILLDFQMPDMDGLTVARRIRDEPALRNLTVILLTSTTDLGSHTERMALNVAAALTKPVRQADLQNRILDVIGLKDSTMLPGKPDSLSRSLESSGLILPPLKILLAEDNVVNQTLAVRMLEKEGHKVTVANNGRSAVEKWNDRDFDLILMDVQMPEMSGLEATASIRAAEQSTGGRIPIIALTAHAMKGDREECLEAGMDDYISKPIDFRKLFGLIARLIPPDSGAELADLPPAPSKAGLPLETDKILERLGGSSELLGEITGLFQEDYPKILLDIENSLEQSDSEGVYRSAHRLKGSIGVFVTNGPFQTALKLETIGRAGELVDAPAALLQLKTELDQLDRALSRLKQEAPS